jgi:hypothetical protein
MWLSCQSMMACLRRDPMRFFRNSTKIFWLWYGHLKSLHESYQLREVKCGENLRKKELDILRKKRCRVTVRVAIFWQKIFPWNTEQNRTDGSSVRIPPVSRKRKTS